MGDPRQRLSGSQQALLEQVLSGDAGHAFPAGPRSRSSHLARLPLTSAQRRIWFQTQLNPMSSEYNLALGLRLRGELDQRALRMALGEMVARHEIFRSRFAVVDQEPVQVVEETAQPDFTFHDLSAMPLDAARRRAAELAREEAGRPFELDRVPLIRLLLARTGTAEHVVVITMHHVVFDGWSTVVFARELSVCYNAFAAGRPPILPPPAVQYGDYALWEQARGRQRELSQHLDYWRGALRGLSPLELPTDRPRPAQRSGRGAKAHFQIPDTLTDALRRLCKQHDATLFMGLLAAFQVLLFRYSGQRDIAVGTLIANRDQPEVENLIGLFVNTVVLRGELGDEPTFAEFLGRVRERTLAALDHQDVPFERLVQELHPRRDLSRTPLFQALFELYQGQAGSWVLDGLDAEEYPIDDSTEKFDLTLTVTEHEQALLGTLSFSTDLFDGSTVGRLVGHYRNLLQSIVADPQVRVGELGLLDAEQQRQLLVDCNRTAVGYPHDRCLHELFEAQVGRTPQAVAVVWGQQRLTYQQLNAHANQLAHQLRGLGVGPETVVGLCVQHHPQLLIGLLGILKAGGAYLPLDPDHPADRLGFMLGDTNAPLLLTQQALLDRLPQHHARTVCLDRDHHDRAHQPTSNLPPLASATNLAYVIYTSGSTGRPKGVMIDHRGLNNYLLWAIDGYGLDASSGAPMLGSIAFDLCIPNLLLPLLGGRDVTLLPNDKTLEHLTGLLQQPDRDFSLLKITPSHLDALRSLLPASTRLDSVRTYVVGADEVKAETVLAWRQLAPSARIIDEYGPTETVVGCSTYLVPDDQDTTRPVCIGKPIANTQMYVLDGHLRPVPTGVAGELYIGGDGVARGYLDRPGLTADNFLPDPYATRPGARFYRTGDRARFLADGNLEFLGRLDNQVKIRAYRIELGEIEARLLSHPRVREAVVAVREDHPGDKRLVGYVVPTSHPAPPAGELRDHLAQALPAYMLPSSLVFLQALPLSPGGKVDRRLLPAPSTHRSDHDHAYRNPRNPTEAQLCDTIAHLLHLDRIGIDDNFFDLGADSMAIIYASRLAKNAGLRIEPIDFYENQTVLALALALADRDDVDPRPADDPDRQLTRVGQSLSLVRLKPEGSRRPLYCVHPSGGSVAWYLGLGRAVDPDQPVLALQPAGMVPGHRPHDRMEEMAAFYLSELRAWQPSGPYALLGWSLGGTIAYEMARQLQEAGEVADPLMLLEPPLPGDERQKERDRRQIEMFRRGADLIELVHGDRGAGEEGEHAHAELIRWLEEMDWPRSSAHPSTIPALRAAAAMLIAYREYNPKPYLGRIHLVVTDECIRADPRHPSRVAHESFDDYLKAWNVLASGGVVVQRGTKVHATMFSGDNVKKIGALCSRLIAERSSARVTP